MSRVWRRLAAPCVALIWTLATLWLMPGAASASGPIALDAHGSDPQVAVDSSGTAHVVWDAAPQTPGMVYCEIPAGGHACTNEQTFPLTTEADAQVLLGPDPREVVLLDTGFDGLFGEGVHSYLSSDGGQTFAPAIVGGDYPTQEGTDPVFLGVHQRPAFGPGAFSASLTDADGYFEAFPINAVPASGPTTDTQLFTSCGGLSATATTVTASGTPVAACYSQSASSIYYRVATGAGDLNDVLTGSWGPVQQIATGSGENGGQGIWMASGLRGVFLLYEAPGGQAAVRKLDGSTFGPATDIAQTYGESLAEDASGDLFAVTQDTSTGRGGKQQRVFTSDDGVHWAEVPVSLSGVPSASASAHADISGCAAAGGTSTGNGFITFNREGSGAYAESFGTAPCGSSASAGSSCPTRLTVGAAQLVAADGCFVARANRTYQIAHPVELNGLTLDPADGSQLVVDTVNHTIDSESGPVVVRVGGVELGAQPIDWLVPAQAGQIKDLHAGGQPVSFVPSADHSQLLGFAIAGQVTPSLGQGGTASLPFNVAMPPPIGAIIGPAPTDDITLHAANSIPGGVSLTPGTVQIKIPTVSLGIAQLTPFEIDYDGDPQVFDGRFGLVLPVVGTQIATHIRLQQGRFVEGDAAADFGDQLPIYPDVFLQKVDLHITAQRGNACATPATDANGPTSIGGGVTLALGPVLDGHSLLSVDGDATYTLPETGCDQPGTFTIDGSGAIVGVHLGNAHLSFRTDGNISFGGSMFLGTNLAGLSANFDGALSLKPPYDFYTTADARVHLLGTSYGPTVGISSIGVEGCLKPLGYVRYLWASGDFDYGLLSSCDLGDITPADLGGDAHAAVAGHSVTIAPHQAAAGILLRAQDGAPLATIVGPGGQRITTPAAQPGQPAHVTHTSQAVVAVVPAQNGTFIKLLHPAAGRWSINPTAVSPAITRVSVAAALPQAHITARVRGRGHDRQLSYESRPAPGRQVRFIESGPGHVSHTIATIDHAHGLIHFHPSPGPGGRRRILAIITERGLVAGSPTQVATYKASAPIALGRPQHLSIQTRHGTRRATWRPATGAVRYAVRLVFADGRAPLRLTRANTRSVTIPELTATDRVTVLVAALDSSGHPGPLARATTTTRARRCQHPRAVHGHLTCLHAAHGSDS